MNHGFLFLSIVHIYQIILWLKTFIFIIWESFVKFINVETYPHMPSYGEVGFKSALKCPVVDCETW